MEERSIALLVKYISTKMNIEKYLNLKMNLIYVDCAILIHSSRKLMDGRGCSSSSPLVPIDTLI